MLVLLTYYLGALLNKYLNEISIILKNVNRQVKFTAYY